MQNWVKNYSVINYKLNEKSNSKINAQEVYRAIGGTLNHFQLW